MRREGVLVWRPIPSLESVGGGRRLSMPFASVSSAETNGGHHGKPNGEKEALASPEQLLRHPLVLPALVPNGLALFTAGALAGAVAKCLNAPLDRIKLLMQTHSLRVGEGSGKKGITFIEVQTIALSYMRAKGDDRILLYTLILKEIQAVQEDEGYHKAVVSFTGH